MNDPMICGGCGQPLEEGTTICRNCGWDLTTAVTRPPRQSILATLRGGAWRVLLYGALIALPFVGFARFRSTGTGPDLATTMRWMILGDGGRAAELLTIHRAHEVATAAARYAVRELEPPPTEDDWATVLAAYSTMRVRGWMPLLFYGATTDMVPASVQEFFELRPTDGWGREYRISARQLPRDTDRDQDPEITADLEAGLKTSFYRVEEPQFDPDTGWLRLELGSAGADGRHGTDDDLRVISYFPVGFTLRLTRRPEDLEREIDRAFTRGRHYYRVEGSRWDLIDARLLAEHRLEYLP
jgi:hypothetical protein